MKNNFNFNEFYAKILRLNNNSLTVLSKLTESFTIYDKSVEYIEIELTDEAGNPQKYRIPAYSFLKTRMVEIEKNVAMLQSANTQANQEYSEISDQNYFIEPDIPGNLKLISTAKYAKNSWLDNLNNIDLFYTIDLTNVISPNSKQIEILKIVIREEDNDTTKMNYIDNLVGKSDLSLNLMKTTFADINQKINFTEERYTYTFPPIELQSSGSFLINSEPESIIEVGVTNYNTTLDIISYNKNGSRVTLNKGDVLVNTKSKVDFYTIESVNSSNKTVMIQKMRGSQAPKKNDILRIASGLGSEKKVDIKCSPFERHIIFVRQITPNLGITSRDFSNGIVIKPSILNITDSNGVTKTLYEYYLDNVYEYGEFFDGLKSEMKIPAMYGITPDAPELNEDTFDVVLINSHTNINNTPDNVQKLILDLNFNISKRDRLLEIQKSNNITISELDKVTNPNNDEIDRLKLENSGIAENLVVINNTITSINKDLSKYVNINIQTYSPKYRVRGYWKFPAPKKDRKGRNQDVIKFEIQYKYSSLEDGLTCSKSTTFTDANGEVVAVKFGEWNEITTKVRDKVWNDATGRYLWEYGDIKLNEPVVNQLDIPISPYEKVDIRIRSISEAGYPENPIKSAWSSTITIEFPSSYYTVKSETDNSISSISEAVKNIEIENQFRILNEKIATLESKLLAKSNSAMNFKEIDITHDMKESNTQKYGVVDIDKNIINLSNIAGKYILINRQPGTVLNPLVDYVLNTNENSFVLTGAVMNGMVVGQKLLLIYSN